MFPRLLEIPTAVEGLGALILPPYFTLLSIGFIFAIYLARRWADRQGLDPRKMVDFGILMVIWGILGSRVLHVLADGHFWDYVHVCTDPSKVDWLVDYRECNRLNGIWDAAAQVCHPAFKNCFAWADITAGGFAFYGGLIAAALFSIWFIKRHNWPGGKLCDMGGWTITLGLAWGRMGCFLAGCCFGARHETWPSVVFPSGSPASRSQWREGLLDTYREASHAVHPTQLYESLAALIIAAVAYFWLRPRKRYDGQVFVWSMVAYAVARFSLEFIRRDERGAILGLSTSQIVALGMIAACIYLSTVFKKKSRAVLGSTDSHQK